MSKKKKIIIWGGVGLAVAAAVGISVYFATRKPQTEYTTAPVERGTVVQTVSVTGDLVDNQEITINFELGGKIKEIMVKEDDLVAAGEIVATLEDADLNSQLSQAKAALSKAVADAEANDDAIDEAEVAKDNAENYLDQVKELNKQNIAAAEQDVENAEDYYEDALDYYNEDKTATRKLTLTTAENSLKDAREAKETADENADLAEVSAKNTLEAAKAGLDTARSNFAARSRNATIESAQAGYNIALNNLSRSVLRSPVNGRVAEVNNKKGEILGTGVIKESFARIISGDLLIEAQIPESDILKIKQGMKADFTLDAIGSDEKFQAEVVEIFPASTLVQDVISYKVKFRITSPDSRFKPGMTANLDIKTAEKNNILRIPLRAIKTEGDHKYVDVLKDNNQTEKVEVTTGLSGDEGMVEVKSGLKEGDKVVTFTKEPS
ncbi:MAG: efflux RND transporter periplasmic adaptor subunit [Candidatus Moranbacteria bacterium]|nr:efflux RND transporter periplasmic adaptor subunit [Candidatus Moranbacteria bacterium]